MHRRSYAHLIFVFLFLSMFAVRAGAVQPSGRGPSEVVAAENNPDFMELFRVKFENVASGTIAVSENGGAAWKPIGRVIVPVSDVSRKGYTASGWAPIGRVAATAVNAVHVKVAQNGEFGVLFSVLPAEMLEKPANYASYYEKSAAMITDMPAGTEFFGGKWAPFIGNRLQILKGDRFEDAPEGYVPAKGDAFQIVVERPKKFPSEMEFENRFGGFVWLRYPDGEQKAVGTVLKPVAGVGRFSGSLYADVGRIRANHTGVICVSTTPLGEIGGFQILPENHGMSAEMANARLLTQWMVIGPTSVFDKSYEGVAPFFQYYIRPVYAPLGPEGRTLDDMLAMFLVQVRIKDGPWERMPSVTGRVDDALKDVTGVRILFPIDNTLGL